MSDVASYTRDVVKILHPGVADVEHDHYVKFLRNSGFSWIGANHSCFHRRGRENGASSGSG